MIKADLNLLFFLLPVLFVVGCAPESKESATEEEWQNLLNEEHASNWRGYNGETLPPGWLIEDGILYYDTELQLEQDYTGGNDVIYAGEKYTYFELTVDWKIPEGGNSGIFYHVEEGYDSPSVISPEYQLIDDENYADIHDLTGYNSQFGAENPAELQDWQKTGADYAMHTADESKKKLNPVGEWNTSRIVVAPEGTEHWLNGEKLLSFEPWTAEWEKKKNSGKWENAPDYGTIKTGYIAFQDHGSSLWFKNVKVKPITNKKNKDQ